MRPNVIDMDANSPTVTSLVDLARRVEAGSSGRGASTDELEIIRLADELVGRSDECLRQAVATARSRGVSWQAVGDALGVSRQAAFKRFDRREERAAPDTYGVDLLQRTNRVFESLDADAYEDVRSLMTYACARALTKRRLMSAWAATRTSTGRLRTIGDSLVLTPEGVTVVGRFLNRHLSTGAIVQVTLIHEEGEWIGRVAYNGSGRITGILIAPPGARDLAF